jgi:hypothetical protein
VVIVWILDRLCTFRAMLCVPPNPDPEMDLDVPNLDAGQGRAALGPANGFSVELGALAGIRECVGPR